MGGYNQNHKIDFIPCMKHDNKWWTNFPVITLNLIENKIINNRKLWQQKPKVHVENKDKGTKYDSLKHLEHTGQKWCSHQSWTG